jgi:hypothetical protein
MLVGVCGACRLRRLTVQDTSVEDGLQKAARAPAIITILKGSPWRETSLEQVKSQIVSGGNLRDYAMSKFGIRSIKRDTVALAATTYALPE